jgi:hypothetical protein
MGGALTKEDLAFWNDKVVHLNGTSKCTPAHSYPGMDHERVDHELFGRSSDESWHQVSTGSWMDWYASMLERDKKKSKKIFRDFDQDDGDLRGLLARTRCPCFYETEPHQWPHQYRRCENTMENPAGAHVTRKQKAWIIPICSHCNFHRPKHRPGEAFRVQKFAFGSYAILVTPKIVPFQNCFFIFFGREPSKFETSEKNLRSRP